MEEYFEYKEGNLYWKNHPSRPSNNGRKVGWPARRGYLVFCVLGKNMAVHRVIYWMHTGEWPEVVDHIDGNILNNSIENLRAATASSNMMNSRKTTKPTASKYKGVLKGNKDNWRARITLQGTRFNLGTFINELDAALAYDKAAKELFGEFAKLNFPE